MSNDKNKSGSKSFVEDSLSLEISRGLQIVDLEKNALSEETAREDIVERSTETDAEIVDIVEYCTSSTSTENSDNIEESQTEYDDDNIESSSAWEKGILVDQQYWEQNVPSKHKNKSRQIKYPASQRPSVTRLNIIAEDTTAPRDPSYFKFDRSTTATLETLIARKYLGSLHNVVSRGENSVVIHADRPVTGDAHRVPFSTGLSGYAVKVYNLTNDTNKNNLILERAQREYEHLCAFRNTSLHPYVVHRLRNVLIYDFIGDNHETAPNIKKLPSEHFHRAYQEIVHDMVLWYSKFNLVHGNLRSKNILFYDVSEHSDRHPLILLTIGWGYSVKTNHPQALMKLMKDCQFITMFFTRRDVPVRSVEELFKLIAGLNMDKISFELQDIKPKPKPKKDLWQKGQLTNPNR